MGFGSYTEDDQGQQERDTTEIDVQKDTRGDFEGDVAFDPGADTDDLVTQLGEIKDNKEQEEEA